MGIIKLTNNGVYFNTYGVEDDAEYDELIDLNNLHYYYDYDVIIESGYRVIDLIYLINNIYEKINYDFTHASRGIDLKQFINESLKKPNNYDDVCHGVVEMGWISELWDNTFDLYPNLYGYEKNNKDEIKISYSFSPLYNWVHLPLILNEDIKIIDFFKGEGEILMSANKKFKLNDIFYCFIYEITFNGDIENRDAILDDLIEVGKRIENGEEKLISFEDMVLEFKKQDLEKSITDEDYEKAAFLKKEIEEIEKKIKNEGH
jgi:hypothetical protein